jgi:PKD repeat protein
MEELETYVASAVPCMGTYAARGLLTDYYGDAENWSARDAQAQAVLDEALSDCVRDALDSVSVLPTQKASMLRTQAIAQLLSEDYTAAFSSFDDIGSLDADGDLDLPPAARLNALEDITPPAKALASVSKSAPSMAQGIPLVDRVDVLDTQNPALHFRMRLPGSELAGDPVLEADQRLVEAFPHPVFYAEEADNGQLLPVVIDLSEEVQADGSTVWREDRNTLKFRGDSEGRQFYRLGQYRLRFAPLGVLSENTDLAVLRQRLATRPASVTRNRADRLTQLGVFGADIDFEHVAAPGQVKEFATLLSQPDYPEDAAWWMLAYRWASNELNPVLVDGAVHWQNDAGTTILRFPPPVVWDDEGAPLRSAYRIRNNLVGVVIPTADLDAAVYPVVIDPTVTTGQADTSANTGIYFVDHGDDIYTDMFARIALPDLTGVSSIDGASFYAKIQTTQGGNISTVAYCEDKGAWTEATGHSTLNAFSFSASTDSQTLSATSGWVSWNILGTTTTTGMAKIYTDDDSPEPCTVKTTDTAETDSPDGKTTGLQLGDTDGGPHRQFYGRTAASADAPYIEIIYTDPPASTPTAAFTEDVTSGDAPLTVTFTDTSTGNGETITAWAWDFGDGATSTSQNPSHTYDAPGTPTVALTVTSAGGSDTITKTDLITVNAVAPTTDFTASPLMGALPLSVVFTDASNDHGTAITAWAWDFGDTNADTTQNPQHTYADSGAYTVSLTTTNAIGNDTETKTTYINVGPRRQLH